MSPERKQFLENARRQRGQYEVTLTTTAANTGTKEEIKTAPIKEIKTRLQKTITNADIQKNQSCMQSTNLGRTPSVSSFKQRKKPLQCAKQVLTGAQHTKESKFT